MSRLKIDVEMLIMALEDHSYDFSHWLDLKTGEIFPISEYVGLVEDDDIREKIDADPFSYRRIEPLSSRVGYEVMADFVEQLSESKARRDLASALQKRHPFRNFKDALLSYPDLREEWFQFHAQEFKRLAVRWLKDEGIEADLVPYSDQRVYGRFD